MTKPYRLDSISPEEMVRQNDYTAEQLKARGLDKWRADPEMFLADLMTRVRMLEEAVVSLQLVIMKAGL